MIATRKWKSVLLSLEPFCPPVSISDLFMSVWCTVQWQSGWGDALNIEFIYQIILGIIIIQGTPTHVCFVYTPHLSVDRGRSIHYESRCWPVVINQFLHLHPRTGSTVTKLSPIMPTPRLISRWVVWFYTNGVAVWGSGLHSCVYSSWSEMRYPANVYIDIFDPQFFGIFFFNLFPWWELSWLIRTISIFLVLFVCFVTGQWMPPP